ncbi:MAG: HD domain-containing protein [Gemmatimonadota bacterium]|nr:HD domain-containing protein [Gemmatimonadota bacterium]MDH3421487.1 HD domain-containing protein [Gemmatimonadota bacterium]
MTTLPDKIVRDPLWETIRLDATAVRIIDTPEFQRLRYIRQLGFTHLVYPGATHTRFDHALGVYHLTATALGRLRERGGVPPEVWEGEELVPYAALLHDIGHYAFSHALEELEPGSVPIHHEDVADRFFASAALRDALAPLGLTAPDRIHELIRGKSEIPLRGLVSGSLDLDKMEYLRRDARFCGVPYGEVDVSRLLEGLQILKDPETERYEVGVHEKAVAALESLLFAKYQMFRNVYWHHAVRAATALYKRIVEEAVGAGLIAPDELVGPTDEELLYQIGRRAVEDDGEIAERIATRWLPSLRHRKLPKRALELTAADLAGRQVEDWAVGDSPWKRAVEDDLAAELALEPGEVVIDFPAKPAMFQLDVLVERRTGVVQRLDMEGLEGLLDLPRVAQELYSSARVLRVFTFERREVSADRVLDRITRPAGSV